MVGGLELSRRQVAAGLVKALSVPPRHPAGRRELDLFDRPPRPGPGDELGLVQPDDALGEGVVVGVAPTPDRADRVGLGEPLGVADREVLDPPVGMVIAISRASRASSARRLVLTRQPTIARLKASTMKAVYTNPALVQT